MEHLLVASSSSRIDSDHTRSQESFTFYCPQFPIPHCVQVSVYRPTQGCASPVILPLHQNETKLHIQLGFIEFRLAHILPSFHLLIMIYDLLFHTILNFIIVILLNGKNGWSADTIDRTLLARHQFDTLIIPHWLLAVIPEYLGVRISVFLCLGDHDTILVRITLFPHDRLEIFDVRVRHL